MTWCCVPFRLELIKADVAAGLAGGFVTETAQRSDKVITADIAGKLQAGMTSSLTM